MKWKIWWWLIKIVFSFSHSKAVMFRTKIKYNSQAVQQVDRNIPAWLNYIQKCSAYYHAVTSFVICKRGMKVFPNWAKRRAAILQNDSPSRPLTPFMTHCSSRHVRLRFCKCEINHSKAASKPSIKSQQASNKYDNKSFKSRPITHHRLYFLTWKLLNFLFFLK